MWTAIAVAVVVVLVGVAGVALLNTLRGYTGHTVPKTDPATLSRLLSPTYRIERPPGEGTFPMLILFSGCDGPKDNMERWALMAREEGWASMIVDSHAPRDFADRQIWRLICAGQLLTGQERAGDVAVAIDDARAMPFVDNERIVLLGASHGGWSILDMLSLHGSERTPHNLTAWPDSIKRRGLAGVVGAILVYPYCGVMSRVRRAGWRHPLDMNFLLARDDAIAREHHCEDLAARMKARGLPVNLAVFDGVTHGFDQLQREPLSPFEFDPQATEAAVNIGRSILRKLSRSAES